ncbi:DUF4142 domain-containing protein [Teichococcus aestuarii]|uniref:DUF4142 domain-containing protein n=1 Tax=Teichococcus aestuarii TaxID=568898 RepID=UPI003619BBF2
MIRRNALAALAGATLVPLLLPAGARAQGTMPAGAMSSDLMEARQAALAGGTFALNSSQLAASRAGQAPVRAFAQFEVAEQQALLQAMQLAGLPLPATVMMPGEKLAMLQQLETLQGDAFDTLYLQGQRLGHRELLAAHQALRGGGLREERVISTLAVASIEQHLAMLQALGAG